jgi:DNA gyrase subunit A
MEARDDDFVNQLFIASTHSYVFFFSDRGKVWVKKIYEIPLAARTAKGRAIVNFIELATDERIVTIAPVKAFEENVYVTTLTQGGQIKKTSVLDYQNYRASGIIGVKIGEDDQLLVASVTDGTQDLLIATKNGKCIRFDEQQVRPMGRNTAGVKAVELEDGDAVVGMTTTDPERNQVLAVCQRGYGKKTPLEDFRVQNRGGKGIILIDCSERNGPVVGIALVKTGDELVLITDRGQIIRMSVNDIRETGRNAQGVKLMNVEDDERIVAVEVVSERAEDEAGEESEGSEAPSPDSAAAGPDSDIPSSDSEVPGPDSDIPPSTT